MCRLNYQADDRGAENFSPLFFIARWYRSNALLTDADGFTISGPITGVLTANYGGKGRTDRDVWKKADMAERRESSADTLFKADFGDFDDFAAERSMVLGGSPYALGEPNGNLLWAPGSGPMAWIHSSSFAKGEWQLMRKTRIGRRPPIRIASPPPPQGADGLFPTRYVCTPTETTAVRPTDEVITNVSQ